MFDIDVMSEDDQVSVYVDLCKAAIDAKNFELADYWIEFDKEQNPNTFCDVWS